MEKFKCRCLMPFVFNEKKYLIGDEVLMTLKEIEDNKRFVFKTYSKK